MTARRYERPAAPVPPAFPLTPARRRRAGRRATSPGSDFFARRAPAPADRAGAGATTATCASRCSTSSRRARSTTSRSADRLPTVGAGVSGNRAPTGATAAASPASTPPAWPSPPASSTSSAACASLSEAALAQLPRHRGGAARRRRSRWSPSVANT